MNYVEEIQGWLKIKDDLHFILKRKVIFVNIWPSKRQAQEIRKSQRGRRNVWRFRQKLGPHSLHALSEQKSESSSLLGHTYISFFFFSSGFRAKCCYVFLMCPMPETFSVQFISFYCKVIRATKTKKRDYWKGGIWD
jgi:hypothetical protein